MRQQRQNRTPSRNRVRYQRQETWSKKHINPKEKRLRYEKQNPHWQPHAPEKNKPTKKAQSIPKN